jgi:hypothetical protein
MAETLIAILILLMVSAIVAGAIPTASNVYARTVDTANAQVLLSTVITVLRDELGTAVSIEDPVGTTLDYVNGNDGYRRLAIQAKSDVKDAPAPGIWLCIGKLNLTTGEIEYTKPGDGESRLLVSKEATTKNLIVSYESVSFSNGIVTFGKLKVERGSVTAAIRDNFSVRTVKKTTKTTS